MGHHLRDHDRPRVHGAPFPSSRTLPFAPLSLGCAPPLIAWQEDSFTYEREAISKWLKDHNTSPKTGETLQSRALIPNHICRAMIRDFQEARAKRTLAQAPPSAGVQQQPA